MTRFNFTSIILCLFNICHGFEFSMERKNYSLKGKSYCGLLRCHVDNVTEDNVSALIKMDIYYLNNRTLLSTMLSKDSEIQSHTGNTVTITGSMSEHHGELRLYFTERVDCLEANFICKINFFNVNGQKDFSEKTTVPTSRENGGEDFYVKSQISFEQTISDHAGKFLMNLISPNDLVQDRNHAMFLKVDAKLNEMMNKVEVCVSRKELTQYNDGHLSMSQIERSLDSISQKLDDLWTIQKMQGEIIANFSNTHTPLMLKEKQLKCERGMDSSLSPRVVTSIYNNTNVLCDTKTDGGGWIIIQRRVKGDTNFNVSWDSYKQGFGSLQGDFWLGNEFISNVTRQDDYVLRIDMTCANVVSHAIYSYFKVEDETQLYTLRLGAYSGNTTDKFSYNKDQAFTTLDRDNDKRQTANCANVEYHISGWWFNDCSYANLNGVWASQAKNFIYWDQQKLDRCSFVEMKIRKKETASFHQVSEF